MASNVVASVAVMIRPITKGFKKNIKDAYREAVKELQPEGAPAPEVSEKDTKRSANKFTKAFGRFAKAGLATAGAAAGVAIGVSFVSGFRSAVTQQQGQKILSGLYGDAEKASETLKGIRDLSSRSPIDYSAYQGAAESLAYAGAQGEDAIGVLENMGKAITAAGGDSSNLDRATDSILKGVNAGKFQLDTLQQLSDAGIPILSGLAEHFGVSIEEVNKMASAGKVQLEDVMAVLSNGTGDVFQQMIVAGEDAASSFGNQWKRAKDNIAVAIGQQLLPLVEMLAPAIEPASEAIVGFIEQIPAMLDGIRDGVQWIKDNIAWIGTLAATLAVAGTAAWIASGGLTAVGLSIKGVFTAISTGIRSVPVIGWIITAIGLLVTALVYVFTQTEWGQRVWAKAWAAIKSAALAVWDWVKTTLWPGLVAAWDAVAGGAIWLYESAILPAWDGIRTAISAVWEWISGTLWPGLQAVWDAIATAAMWLWQSIFVPAWNGIKLAVAIAVTAVLVAIELLKWIFEHVIAPVALWLWHNVFEPVWEGIQAAIDAVVAWFQNVAWPVLQQVIDWIANAFEMFKIGLGIVWDFIKNQVIAPVVAWFRDVVWPLIDRVLGWIKMSFEGWKIILGAIWDFVKNRIINPVITWFRDTAWPLIDRVIDWIQQAFEDFKTGLGIIWDFIKDQIIAPVVSWFENTVQPKIDAVTGHIQSAFETMKTGIKKAWDAIKDAARTPVRFVVEDVYNDTLRSTFNGVADKLSLPDKWRLPKGTVGFATGGIMPGYSPGRDIHRFISPTGGVLDLSGGEPILRPEAGRVLGADWVHGINAAARTAGVSGVQAFLGAGAHQAFAGGGILGRIRDIGGDAWDWLTDTASAVARAIADPLGILKDLAGKATELIPGGGLFRAATVQVGKNAGEMLGDWLSDQLAPAAVDGTPVASRSGGSLALASQLARSLGLRMTSGYRPGSRTAGAGSVSYHALGRARDYAGSSTAMMQLFNLLHPYAPTELLYSPAGGRQWRRWGVQQNTSGVTRRNHWDHVHVAFRDGGMLSPTLFDSGGILPPGLSTVLNASGKPEAVLTNEQLTQLRIIASGRAGEDSGDVFQVFAQNDKAEELVSELMWAQKTRPRRGRYATARR